MTKSSVLISYDDGEPPLSLSVDDAKVIDFILIILKKRAHLNWDVSLFFANDERMKALNLQYRNIDSSTDVLSFGMGEEYTNEEGKERYNAGDIVINLKRVCENAHTFGVCVNEELKRVIIHSILHLEGMDHATNNKEEPMLLLQEEILASFGDELLIEEKNFDCNL